MAGRISVLLSAILILSSEAIALQTPPVQPRIQETPLPPAVELPAPPGAAQAPDRPITANEAAIIALRNQPDVMVARAGIDAAGGRVQQARAGLLPSVGVGLGYTRFESLTGGSSGGGGTVGLPGGGSVVASPGYQASVNLRQLLFDFGRTRSQVRQTEALRNAASANLARVQSDLVQLVKQSFYTFVQNTRLVEVNESNVRAAQVQQAAAQARLNSGLGLPIDVVRAQTAVAQAIQALTVARNNASVSRVNLAAIMGVDPRTPIRAADADEPAITVTDFNSLVTKALTQRPDVLQARETVRAAENGLSAARKSNSPALSANLGLGGRGTSIVPNSTFASVGANIAWSPFDSGLTSGRVREAQANLESARADMRNVELSVTSDVSQAYLNLRTAEQRVATGEAEVVNAQEVVRLAQGRFSGGLGIFIEVIDAQNALLTARTNRVNALSAVDQARAALSRAIAAPLPTGP